MALLARPLNIDGSSWGTVYTFEHASDVFPTHVHTEGDNHITVLAFGSIRCVGHKKHDGVELHAAPGGTIVSWTAGEPHGFVALVDGTTLINLLRRRPT